MQVQQGFHGLLKAREVAVGGEEAKYLGQIDGVFLTQVDHVSLELFEQLLAREGTQVYLERVLVV